MKKERKQLHSKRIETTWSKIQNKELPNIDNSLPKAEFAGRDTWYKFKKFLRCLSKHYEQIGYKSYAITIKRGRKNADLKVMCEALKSALKDLNRKFFKNTIPGLELPYFTFEGNSIDGSYNPHLHVVIWIPRGKVIFTRCFLEESILHCFANLSRRKVTLRERLELNVWMKKLSGKLEDYIGYCARLEDENKGKDFEKIVWELCSFGFKSGEQNKQSKRILRRMYHKFPASKHDSVLRHKVYVMLHWMISTRCPRKNLRYFLPTLSTDNPKVERPPIFTSIRELLLDEVGKKHKLRFRNCHFAIIEKALAGDASHDLKRGK